MISILFTTTKKISMKIYCFLCIFKFSLSLYFLNVLKFVSLILFFFIFILPVAKSGEAFHMTFLRAPWTICKTIADLAFSAKTYLPKKNREKIFTEKKVREVGIIFRLSWVAKKSKKKLISWPGGPESDDPGKARRGRLSEFVAPSCRFWHFSPLSVSGVFIINFETPTIFCHLVFEMRTDSTPRRAFPGSSDSGPPGHEINFFLRFFRYSTQTENNFNLANFFLREYFFTRFFWVNIVSLKMPNLQ